MRRTASVLDNLFAQGIVRGARLMARGGKPALSLFDALFVELGALFVQRNWRRYEPFGIAIDKRYASYGRAPGHLLALARSGRIARPEERWRVVTNEMDRTLPVDRTRERERRVARDLLLETRSFSALLASRSEARAIFEDFDLRADALALEALLGSCA